MFPRKSETVPDKTSSSHRPHCLPKLDPEGGHPISPNMTEKDSNETHDDSIKKMVDSILKKITDWKEVLAANKELFSNWLEIENKIEVLELEVLYVECEGRIEPLNELEEYLSNRLKVLEEINDTDEEEAAIDRVVKCLEII